MSLGRESARTSEVSRSQGGRDQKEKLGGHNLLPQKSITLWEAHVGGVPSATLAGRGVSRWRLHSGTPPPPPPPASSDFQGSQRISQQCTFHLPSDFCFPRKPSLPSTWEAHPFPAIVPVPGHHSSDTGPAWQQHPHPCTHTHPAPCPGLRKPEQLI